MPLVNSGRTLIAAALMGDPAVDALDAAHAYLGVGASPFAFAVTQHDLQAPSNKVRAGMYAGYPARTGISITYLAIFAEDAANFDWNEWGLFNAASGGLMLNRKVRYLGTKPDDEIWRLLVTVSIKIGA